MDAAGFPVRVLSRDGALLFGASDIAAAGGVYIANGSTLRGLPPGDAVRVPRAEAGIARKGAPVPFLTLAGAFHMLRRSQRPSAFVFASWLFATAAPADASFGSALPSAA